MRLVWLCFFALITTSSVQAFNFSQVINQAKEAMSEFGQSVSATMSNFGQELSFLWKVARDIVTKGEETTFNLVDQFFHAHPQTHKPVIAACASTVVQHIDYVKPACSLVRSVTKRGGYPEEYEQLDFPPPIVENGTLPLLSAY